MPNYHPAKRVGQDENKISCHNGTYQKKVGPSKKVGQDVNKFSCIKGFYQKKVGTIKKMKKMFLEIGEIVGTHGVRGEMRVNPWCDTPEFFKKFKKFYFDAEGKKEVKATSVRPHGNIVLLKLDGIDTMEDALSLKGKVLYMNRKDVRLPEGDYFISDLFDCTVIDADDENIKYGILTDVSKTGANDVWHITKDGKEYLIPAIPDVVDSVDIDTGIIKIRPLRGIFDDED